MVKNTDILFNRASRLLDIADKIWLKQDKKNYSYADRCYQEAVFIRDNFDNKKMLTHDEEPF
jgi:hypothetical protein